MSISNHWRELPVDNALRTISVRGFRATSHPTSKQMIDATTSLAFSMHANKGDQIGKALVERTQWLNQFDVGEPIRPGPNDALGHIEHLRRHYGLKRTFFFDPHVRRVFHPELFQLERPTVVDVVANVLFVAQHLTDRGTGPATT